MAPSTSGKALRPATSARTPHADLGLARSPQAECEASLDNHASPCTSKRGATHLQGLQQRLPLTAPKSTSLHSEQPTPTRSSSGARTPASSREPKWPARWPTATSRPGGPFRRARLARVQCLEVSQTATRGGASVLRPEPALREHHRPRRAQRLQGRRARLRAAASPNFTQRVQATTG